MMRKRDKLNMSEKREKQRLKLREKNSKIEAKKKKIWKTEPSRKIIQGKRVISRNITQESGRRKLFYSYVFFASKLPSQTV